MSLKTWTKRFDAFKQGQPITKGLINALARIVRDVDTDDRDFRGKVILDTDYELIWNKTKGWAITPEQTEQGLHWLRRPAMGKFLTPTDERILDAFSHFTFVGYELIDATTHPRFPRLETRPVYRVHSTHGEYFDYSSAPWQRGAYERPAEAKPFKVLSRGKA